MAYNLSLVNATGVLPLVQTVNENMMYGYFGISLLITIYIILMMSFSRFTGDGLRSLSYASTIVAVLSLPLMVVDLIPGQAVFICWILAALSALLTFNK